MHHVFSCSTMAGSGEGTYVFTLGDKVLKKAQSELHEKDKWRARDIEALREKIKAHPGECTQRGVCVGGGDTPETSQPARHDPCCAFLQD